MLSYAALRPLLFKLPPESAHRLAIRALQLGLGPRSRYKNPALASEVAGVTFPNPVGLAAGFDKNAECYKGALAAGFGYVEVGTVTPRAQAGNPAPRLFRLPEHDAVINRLGFNNEGVEAAARRLFDSKPGRGVVGGNIGKNKETVDAILDYTDAMRLIYPMVDYITANISSPNTPGLRTLQATDELRALIKALQATRAEIRRCNLRHKPIFVKIAPDCDEAMLEAIVGVAMEEGLDGLIISNTTLSRDAVAGHPHAQEKGGLSGMPLFTPSTEALRIAYRYTKGKLPLIGVGGIASAEDAYEKIRAGANLVQLYTALIYRGFGLVEDINRGLAAFLERDGFSTIREAVGTGA